MKHKHQSSIPHRAPWKREDMQNSSEPQNRQSSRQAKRTLPCLSIYDTVKDRTPSLSLYIYTHTQRMLCCIQRLDDVCDSTCPPSAREACARGGATATGMSRFFVPHDEVDRRRSRAICIWRLGRRCHGRGYPPHTPPTRGSTCVEVARRD
jgi:hypothetical protein